MTTTTNSAPPPPPSRRRRYLRRALKAVVILFCLWFFGTGIATFCLVHRLWFPRSLPAPKVDWAKIEDVRLTTADGVSIGGWVIRAGERPSVVLLLHGVGESKAKLLPRMQKLAEHHYPSLAISLRAHGDSGGSVNDFGFRAKEDVIAAVNYLRGQFPGRPIVIVGNSLGSASAIFAAGPLDHEVAGYFLESPYRDLRTAVKNRTNMAPRPFNLAAYAGLRMWGHLWLPEDPELVRPIDEVSKIPPDVPVTFLAARDDPVCKLFEVQDLYKKVKGHAKIDVIESHRHGVLSRTNADEYYAQLFDLLGQTDAKHAGKTDANPIAGGTR